MSYWPDGQNYSAMSYEAATVQEAIEEVDQGKTWTRFARAVREAVSGLLD